MACRMRIALGLVFALAFAADPGLAQKADPLALCIADKTEKGLAACNTVLKGRGDARTKAKARLARAQIHWAAGRLAEAEADYGETIKLAPNAAPLYRDRGRIRYALGNRTGAMADFDVAVERGPFDADNHANRGFLKLLGDDFEGAREDFRKGLFWQKDHPRSHYMVGLLHYLTGRYGDAIIAIGEARALGFKGNEGFITKARSHFHLGAFDAVETEASEGLTTFPAVHDLIEIRARARLALRRLPEALADAEAVVQAAPTSGRAFATRAAVRLAMKDIAGAGADADKAIELDPKLFDAHELKAEILIAAGDKPGARALFQRSATRKDAVTDYDKTSRNRAAARVVELDRPPPIVVAELDEAELKKRCDTRDDPLRLQSCDRLVETAATPEVKADRLIRRAEAKPFAEMLGELDLAVAAAPGYAPALTARSYAHLGTARGAAGGEPLRRAAADADSAVRFAASGSEAWRNAVLARVTVASRAGRFADAEADLTLIAEAQPDFLVFIAADRATARLMIGRPAEALSDVALAERSQTDSFSDYEADRLARLRILALLDLGRADEARTSLKEWQSKRSDEFSARMRISLEPRALLLAGADRAAFDQAAKEADPHGLNKGAIAARGARRRGGAARRRARGRDRSDRRDR